MNVSISSSVAEGVDVVPSASDAVMQFAILLFHDLDHNVFYVLR